MDNEIKIKVGSVVVLNAATGFAMTVGKVDKENNKVDVYYIKDRDIVLKTGIPIEALTVLA